VAISHQYSDMNVGIKFLEEQLPKVVKNRDAHLLLRSVLVSRHLQANNMTEAKTYLDELKIEIEGMTGLETVINEQFYLSAAQYFKAKASPEAFYRNYLLYLVYVPLETLSETKQREIALDLSLAALVGETIYNFGELISHPILQSLANTENDWMINFLNAFNTGDIENYHSLIVSHSQQLNNYPILISNKVILERKISIMALMELVFQTASENRAISFADIARCTKLPIDQIELLVMKAFCLKVVKGTVDEVNQIVYFTWVQPRILDLKQVKDMQTRIKNWAQNVHEMRNSMEDQSHEIF